MQPGANLNCLREREIADARSAVAETPGLLLRAVGLNPQTWSLVRFDYWTRSLAELPEGAHGYEVLHVSAPGVNAHGQHGDRRVERSKCEIIDRQGPGEQQAAKLRYYVAPATSESAIQLVRTSAPELWEGGEV